MNVLCFKVDDEPVWRDKTQKISNNIYLSEMMCKCGCRTAMVHKDQIALIQCIADYYGIPMHFTSWYRCPRHNDAIGSGDYSMHAQGKATDCISFIPSKMTKEETLEFIEVCIKNGAHELGFYYADSGYNFVHISCGNSRDYVTYKGCRIYVKGKDKYGLMKLRD